MSEETEIFKLNIMFLLGIGLEDFKILWYHYFKQIFLFYMEHVSLFCSVCFSYYSLIFAPHRLIACK